MLYKCTASDAWAPSDAPVSVSVGANASCLLAFFCASFSVLRVMVVPTEVEQLTCLGAVRGKAAAGQQRQIF
jgi:hypothetical protein